MGGDADRLSDSTPWSAEALGIAVRAAVDGDRNSAGEGLLGICSLALPSNTVGLLAESAW